MKNIATFFFVFFLAGGASAESLSLDEVDAEHLQCHSRYVLKALAETIEFVNKLPPGLVYSFYDVKGHDHVNNDPNLSKIECAAFLNLSHDNPAAPIDTLLIEYSVSKNLNGTYSISFEPRR